MLSEDVFQTIDQLIEKSIANKLMTRLDQRYVRNQILGLLKLDSFDETNYQSSNETVPALLDTLVTYAVDKNIIDNILSDKEILRAQIMNCFLSNPTEINQTFYQKYQVHPQAATDYFYKLSKSSNYIQTDRIAKNIHYKVASPYGDLDITINLSKPEKDLEQLKKEREMKQTIQYPQCVLCAENEGYIGHIGHPARSNHRIIEVPLDEEIWFLQYSPYVYYNEHCILLSSEHRPMKINRATFERLTGFVEKFPHYFMGSNADIPIVGGSILAHDHYQGGHYAFAMTKAKEKYPFPLATFPTVSASIVNWPLSVLRLRSQSKKDIIDAATFILGKWRNYNDPSVEIIAYSAETNHNTITPIARIRGQQFELDLILRNNRTTSTYPYGIFHPHEDVHHIKKENIGLIEAMGLAVLPPRLKKELGEIRAHLSNPKSPVASYHQSWVSQIKAQHSDINEQNVEQIISQELGKKFVRVLEDSGVFKSNLEGNEAFKRFIRTLNE
ncbi:galactose-1-phosphate uridylyltransferase [Paraliobacillus ryukyuensis]|uniref:Galactose-1-phosphate uridylyltransferase n=1 Tax=Paraliobacillus ryukyuensis TaxID=200904 RepID=A0A366EG56_9BACI|nr:UDP-glucose--hexose-1-phosphate uridylyltransferase [Paraliobacillus ryukyuensis]RBP00435.1 UDPglucose--hexose-1-phosphate uridylyltransferase [Paraliobacillus ryukyuensis]